MERLPEGPPAVKPVPRQLVASVEFQESVEDWPWSMIEGEAERVFVGWKREQEAGLVAPLLQVGGGVGPHPPLQAVQLFPFQTRGSVQVVQVGGLFAPLVQGQTCVLHDWELAPEHVAPPYCGAGSVQVRVRAPPPQETEQAPQPLQPPSMGAFVTTTEPEADDDLPAAFVQVKLHMAFPGGHARAPELYDVLGDGTDWSVQLPA